MSSKHQAVPSSLKHVMVLISEGIPFLCAALLRCNRIDGKCVVRLSCFFVEHATRDSKTLPKKSSGVHWVGGKIIILPSTFVPWNVFRSILSSFVFFLIFLIHFSYD